MTISAPSFIGTDPQSPPFSSTQTHVSNAAGGPGAAEPAECPDAPWLFVRPRAPQPFIPPDRMETPFRYLHDGAGVAAILDKHGRTVTFIRSEEAEGYVHWRNMQRW